MKNAQKKSFKNFAETFHKLPAQKQERAIGIMQGMLMMAEEAKMAQGGGTLKQ